MPYTWYFFPKDDHTNEVFARSLPAENALVGQKCEDGKKRDLWRCDYGFVARIKGSNSLRYDVFRQEGNGKIRIGDIPKKKKIHQLKRARDIRTSRAAQKRT